MRLFVTATAAVFLVVIGYTVMTIQDNDTGNNGDSSDQSDVANTGVDQPDAAPTMPILDNDTTESEIDDEATTTAEPEMDNERCVDGDPDADTPIADRMIIVDPGHGGEDLGTINAQFDLTESEFVLPISERLRDNLVEDGANVCLTRIEDNYIELGERAEFANEHEGDAFVSIHLNSLPDPTESYTMTMWGDEAKDRLLAEVMVEHLRHEMTDPDELNGDPNPMAPDVYRIDYLESSMLKSVQMPATLVEASFLSATWEAQALLDGREDGSHWREEQIADLVHQGLIDYFEEVER